MLTKLITTYRQTPMNLSSTVRSNLDLLLNILNSHHTLNTLTVTHYDTYKLTQLVTITGILYTINTIIINPNSHYYSSIYSLLPTLSLSDILINKLSLNLDIRLLFNITLIPSLQSLYT